MKENLAYWQLDFTVENQANLAQDCMVMQEKSKSFQTLGLLYSSPYGLPRTAFDRMRPTALHYFQIISSKPGLIPAL